jgi:KAP family P-loop domain
VQVQETIWGELSLSSKDALRWAAAMARMRADRAGRPIDGAEVDEFDLLVGIMLAHPDRSEPRQLLEHVGASAADVLPPNYPAPGKELERYGAGIPDQSPELTQPVDNAVMVATQQPRGGDNVVELKSLFGGLLYSSNPVSSAFRELLARVGLPNVVDGYREYLTDSSLDDYATFLGRRYPYDEAPVEVPDYKADKAEIGDDLVDIRAEVDAFAYLLASKSLKPPLAVGLFGDWGSGKTFFMESVRERIKQLAASEEALKTPQKALPFWKQIVQIDFNAWHYVKGDLWASLVEHVFSELRVSGDKDDTELAKRQKHWLDQIEAKRQERSDVLVQLQKKKSAQGEARDSFESAVKKRKEEQQKLARAQEEARADLLLRSSKKAAKDALAEFAESATDGTARDALGAISDLRAQLQRAPGAVGAYPWTKPKTFLAFGALLAVPLLVFALSQLESIPVVAQAFAGVSAALGLVAGAVRSVTSWTKARLDKLAEAEAAIKADINEQQRKLDETVEAAATRVAEADAEVAKLSARDSTLEQEIDALEEQAKSMTSGRILGEFVAERVGSSDYRKLLGTAALIQRDFDALSKLIDEQNKEFVETDKGGEPPKPETLNRIILYIDDLDRCEPERVIDVLQAVHLLLAFPLFVVVVAVDSRWLAQSLEEHYPALTVSPRNGGSQSPDEDEVDEPSPSDYLEKIFQVPFWIEPLGEHGRRSLVRGLLQGNLVTTGSSDEPVSGVEPLGFSRDSEEMVRETFGGTRAIRMQTAALSVTPIEFTFLDELAPLLGKTPRSIKRFVNVYQLLCALPLPPDVESPLYEEAVAFILAITDGLPALSAALSEELRTPSAGATLGSAVARARTMLPPDEVERYDKWAPHHPGLVGADLQRLVEPARRVARFSFR